MVLVAFDIISGKNWIQVIMLYRKHIFSQTTNTIISIYYVSDSGSFKIKHAQVDIKHITYENV